MKNKERRFKKILIVLVSIFIVFSIITFLRYDTYIEKAYKRIKNYPVQSIETNYGKVSYLDSGKGEAILFSHGIFGGYDQGYQTLKNILNNGYRKITPSRFGYPGSDLPLNGTPKKQAEVFVEILDALDIEKTFIMATSAGGAPGIRMAIESPHRVKGLILLSSDMPTTKKSIEEIEGPLGPPAPLLNDFPMWFVVKHFGFVMESMFGSEVPDEIYETMMPVAPRKQGIKNDTNLTNLDMSLNYDEYPMDEIDLPILVIHAKDDPMAKYDEVKKIFARVKIEKAIFETGGHLITGHQKKINKEIKRFIEKNK